MEIKKLNDIDKEMLNEIKEIQEEIKKQNVTAVVIGYVNKAKETKCWFVATDSWLELVGLVAVTKSIIEQGADVK